MSVMNPDSIDFKPSRFTIRIKQLIVITAILVASLTGLILAATYFFRSDTEARVQETNLRFAEIGASRVHLELQNYRIMAEDLLRRNAELVSTEERGIVFCALASSAGQGLHYNRTIVDADFMAVQGGLDGIARRIGDDAREFTKSFRGGQTALNISPSFNIPLLGLSFPRREGGLLLVIVEPGELLKTFSNVGATESFLVDTKGRVVAHPTSNLVLSRENLSALGIVQFMLAGNLDNGQVRYRDSRGYQLGSYKKLGAEGLAMIVSTPEDRAFEAVYAIQRRNVYITIAFLNMAMLVVFFFSRRFSVPIIRLVDATKQMETGDYNVKIRPAAGDEIGILTNSFLKMAKVIKDYTDNLEQKVDDRTRELRQAKHETDDILSNVSQGIITVNRDGIINSEYSAMVERIFGTKNIAGRSIADLVKVTPEIEALLSRYLTQLFTNSYASEDMVRSLNPLSEWTYSPEKGTDTSLKFLRFTFARIYEPEPFEAAARENLNVVPNKGKRRKVEKLMAVIEDRTAHNELERELENRRAQQSAKIEMFYQILTLDSAVFSDFVREGLESLDEVEAKLGSMTADHEQNIILLRAVSREVHTLKGNARALSLDLISRVAHELEDGFARLLESGGDFTASMKDDVLPRLVMLREEVQDAVNLFKKIVESRGPQSRISSVDDSSIGEILHNVTEKEAGALGKEVSLNYDNRLRNPLPGVLFSKLKSVLIHILRNSVGHGIEEPDTREHAGKNRAGKIVVQISLSSKSKRLAASCYRIVCEDDGRGLDPQLIRSKAIEKGLLKRAGADKMNDEESRDLIFLPGFSTAATITETSGRGMGMDIVRHELKELGGEIQVESVTGQFTRFTILIPAKEWTSGARSH